MTREYIEENLITKTSELNPRKAKQTNLSIEELYLIYHNIEAPLCGCGQKRKFYNFVKGYWGSCRTKCNFSLKIKREKMKNTNIERYGVEFPLQKPEIQEKIKKTNKEKYGIENQSQRLEVKKKKIQTSLKNYRTENPSQSEEIKEKKKQTSLKNNGTANPFQSEEIKKRIKDINKERYGVEFPSQNPEIQEKTKNTNMERYGAGHSSQKHILNFDNLNEEYIRLNFIKDSMFLIEDVMLYFNIGVITIYNLKSKYKITESNLSAKPKLEDRLNTLFNNTFITNTRSIIKPLELDLYSEEFKFAIEYDGLMYHSSGESIYSKFNKPEKPDYHLNKTLKCQEKDIILFHIFENEWINENTRDIWISKINSMLKRNKTIETNIIKEISIEIAKEFIQENCLEQNTYNENIGLFHEDELIMVISLEEDIFKVISKKHINTLNGKEILIDYITEKYKRKFKTIINRRWHSGDYINYNKSYTEPNSFYFNKSLILEDKHQENYRKIWDCGNIILETRMV